MSLPQAQLPQGFIKKKKKAFSAAYIEAICQPLKTGISHNILPYLTSLFITLILKVEECMMKIIFNKLPLPVSLTQTHNSSALALLTSLESER